MLMVMMVVMAMISMIRLTSRSEGKDTQVSPDPSPLTPCRDRARRIDWSLIAVNSLNTANMSELRYGVLGTAPNLELREEINFLMSTSSNNGLKTNLWSCSYKL